MSTDGQTVNDELSRVLERMRQNRAARARDGRTARGGDTPAAAAAPGALVAGSRAFDLVTGHVVEVVSVYRENVVGAAAERRDA
jgi:hypothetical protein